MKSASTSIRAARQAIDLELPKLDPPDAPLKRSDWNTFKNAYVRVDYFEDRRSDRSLYEAIRIYLEGHELIEATMVNIRVEHISVASQRLEENEAKRNINHIKGCFAPVRAAFIAATK